ncbi:MAG: hypothetical protein HYT65_01950 [Candidatus Yanofskybacteria bacterium]|nr:hypothetical protein [Candidatus Yanofskybacteria bacterium]
MGDETSSPVDAVIFFDANMPNMHKCSAGCKVRETQLCKHRFNFNAKVIHPTEYISFMRFYDFQIILHCLYLIKGNSRFKYLAENGKFVIVTKDRTFLRDAQDVWVKKLKPKTRPKLEFGRDFVSCGSWTIKVKLINCKNYGTNGDHDLFCTIDELNKLWASRKSDS